MRVRRVALDAYANADAPFDSVVEALRPARNPGRSPLIQTLFSFHDSPRTAEGWTGLRAKLVQVVPNGTAKADLNVIGIDDRDRGLTFVWEHSDLFADATADRLAGHHLALLAEFARRPRRTSVRARPARRGGAGRAQCLQRHPGSVRPRGDRSRAGRTPSSAQPGCDRRDRRSRSPLLRRSGCAGPRGGRVAACAGRRAR